MNRIIAHVDMDCFFAACEEKQNPDLKNFPLVIGALPENKRGVVSTANYEARKFGVHSAQSINKAYSLCPHANFLRPNMKLYSDDSKAVMNVLRIFSSKFQQVSVDEAYLDITDFALEQNSLKEAAKKIQEAVLNETKLTCSIGISNSKYVSKIASDYKKPAGITVVNNHKEFLSKLPINKICGVGKKSAEKLISLGVKTISDLANVSPFFLMDHFGKHLLIYQKVAKGLDRTIITKQKTKFPSSSREITFLEDISLNNCSSHILDLSKRLKVDLNKTSFKTISIKVRFHDFHTITRDFTLLSRSQNIEEIVHHSHELLKKVIKENHLKNKVRLFGIKIGQLRKEEEKQMTLFTY